MEQIEALDTSGGDQEEVLTAYHRLRSRRVDLVGDYAGSELFIIDGDSLLLRCFDDAHLDFANGFQLLHAVYLVEHFLQNLQQRKCTFQIVFFDQNAKLCIPASAHVEHEPKYFLARAIIIRHLSSAVQNLRSDILVHVFETWTSPQFSQHLRTMSPYFLMIHDGAQHAAVMDTADPKQQKMKLRTMIVNLIDQGYNIALINELQWQDTKIMANVLESLKRSVIRHTFDLFSSPVHSTETRDIALELRQLHASNNRFKERELLAIITISTMLKDTPSIVRFHEQLKPYIDFLKHEALILHLPIRARRFAGNVFSDSQQQFMYAVASLSTSILSDLSWPAEMLSENIVCDIADYIDGRLFSLVSEGRIQLGTASSKTFRQLKAGVELLTGFDIPSCCDEDHSDIERANKSSNIDEKVSEVETLKILPFSNHVFDKHFDNIRIYVDTAISDEPNIRASQQFKETSHWHDARKPLVQKGPPIPRESWQAKKAATRNQRFMAEMQKYAASLTNAVGKALEPEIIVVRSDQINSTKSESKDKGWLSVSVKHKASQAPKMDKKTMAKNAQKANFAAQRASGQAQRAAASADQTLAAFQLVRTDIEKIPDPQIRYKKTQIYLGNLSAAAAKGVVNVECQLYMASCLVLVWQTLSRGKLPARAYSVAALIWHHFSCVARHRDLSISNIKYMTSIINAVGLPDLYWPLESKLQRQLSFTPYAPTILSPPARSANRDFLLLHCGPYLERSFDSAPDARVDFQPDAWQRQVLDSIDANQSVFVVAPTSAGKTFISFYAMRKILEADDEGILVYVAPTKALVNQIGAEIQARYSKSYKRPGRSVWAIHTRDYRVNNPNGCQVLVTVPHILQIMLMSPSNASTWSTRIRRIIFDEVHSIGQADDGVVWEQLLLMAPCPIIALSATVGNPAEFASWLTSTQHAIGVRLETITHPHRYSDLRKFYYDPPAEFAFQGLPEQADFSEIGLDDLVGLSHIHPITALVDRSQRLPDDLALEPRDCLYLWQAMTKVENTKYQVAASLAPKIALPASFPKRDVLVWEASLKALVQKWLEDADSPFEELLQELRKQHSNPARGNDTVTRSNVDASTADIGNTTDPVKTVLPLLCQLYERDALPAIIFNYDRIGCEQICKSVLTELETTEKIQVKSGPKWQRKIDEWERWRAKKAASDAKQAKQIEANEKRKSSRKKGSKDDGGEVHSSKSVAQQELASIEISRWQLFDPDSPEKGYHFADYTKLQASELREILSELDNRGIDPRLITALSRGLGVHHAGMNRKYRQVVEMLFRKRFLGVVIATGTLALGVNMPCKTVIFSGDSIYLTALNYRQCAGRAGRRGFDLLGNVVFQGISKQKVNRLISSRLPSLNGHFPITTSFVLRLFVLLTESKNSDYAVTAIDSVLSQPRLYMGGSNFKEQTMHHLRFSIEYLRRQNLLSGEGAPLNLAGLVSHLYYTEQSAFAFHALMKEGFFNDLCAGFDFNQQETLLTLMLVMSHIFGRFACRRSDVEFYNNVVKPSSSIVFLPPLPDAASKILRAHNKETQTIFETYVRTFVDQHVTFDDNTLPLTGIKCGGNDTTDVVPSLAPTHIRSAFVALSGAGDTFSSIHDLCSTVRSGVFLEEAVIPYIQISPEDTDAPLNAWLLDFYKHGDIATLERANGIRKSDVWFYLNDFSLVLATIVTSLTNMIGLNPDGDMDVDMLMLDLQGEMDTLEEAQDDAIATTVEAGGDQKQQMGQQLHHHEPLVSAAQHHYSKDTYKQFIKNQRAKVLESWDDDSDSSTSSKKSEPHHLAAPSESSQDPTPATTEHTAVDRGTEELCDVLRAFRALQANFNEKFKAMWA